MKHERYKKWVEAWQKKQNVDSRCDLYEFYEDLLERKDIDAVSIATPDCSTNTLCCLGNIATELQPPPLNGTRQH